MSNEWSCAYGPRVQPQSRPIYTSDFHYGAGYIGKRSVFPPSPNFALNSLNNVASQKRKSHRNIRTSRPCMSDTLRAYVNSLKGGDSTCSRNHLNSLLYKPFPGWNDTTGGLRHQTANME